MVGLRAGAGAEGLPSLALAAVGAGSGRLAEHHWRGRLGHQSNPEGPGFVVLRGLGPGMRLERGGHALSMRLGVRGRLEWQPRLSSRYCRQRPLAPA